MEAALHWTTQPQVMFVDACFMYVPVPDLNEEKRFVRKLRPLLLVLIGSRDFPAADAFDIRPVDYFQYTSDL